MVEWILPRARSIATLAVLAVLLLIGVSWAWGAITEPFPEKAETPVCVDQALDPGDTLRPAGMTVSVLNASGRNGLAGDTLDDLEERGFGTGDTGDAPSGTRVTGAQIWAADPDSPTVRLLRSYLSGEVEVVDAVSGAPGITVVLGEDFSGVKNGRESVRVRAASSACVPTGITSGSGDQQDTPTDSEETSEPDGVDA